ncbi:unnamed protein product [Scytosiphon promiscuus]
MSLNVLLGLRKPDHGTVQVVEAAGLLLGIEKAGEGYDAHTGVSKTLQASFAAAGNARGAPGLAPPWAESTPSALGNSNVHNCSPPLTGTARDVERHNKSEKGSTANSAGEGTSSDEVAAAVRALKLAVVGVTQRLMNDVGLLPLQNRTTAVLIDGSRMSLLALELAGAAWKFGSRFVVIHVSGEKHPGQRGDGNDNSGRRRNRHAGIDNHGQGGAGRKTKGYGRWEPSFLEEELRETCLRQLEIPEESFDLVFRSLPAGSSATVNEVTETIDTILIERGVEVVFMGCYGRGGPRVSQFGRVAHWAMEHTPYQASCCDFQNDHGISTYPPVSHTLDRLLPLISPQDSLVLIHIVDECTEDVLAGDMVDVEQVESDLSSLLADKRGLSYRVRVEKTGRPPEHPTQTVVQRIVKVAEEEAADFLAILYDESRGSYRTVATGCLRETRCGLIAIH